MTMLTNHLGFTPDAAKVCLRGGPAEGAFIVREVYTGAAIFEGRLVRVRSDLGVYTLGRFDAVRKPGVYVVEAGRERTQPFRVGHRVYQSTLQSIVSYFTLQRCGDTERGWRGAPCHLDDGRRGDTLAHQDVEGGWHDACDIRKWVDATIFGMVGLSQLKAVLDPAWDEGEILDELRWGNRYFLKMQEPEGYVMNYCGGDYFVHADNNRWTDNVESEDDRMIDVRPAGITAQWLFVLAQARAAEQAQPVDPDYAEICEAAARRCLDWLLATERTHTAGELGAAIPALLALHARTGVDYLFDRALAFAERLLRLQVTRAVDSRSPVWGFFWDRRDPDQQPTSLEPFKAISRGCWPLIGLCALLEAAPDHPQAVAWREGVRLFCDRYLAPMASRNAFGIVPFGLYRHAVGGDRRVGKFWYRWFMEANPGWYVGINANLASTGVGLAKAGRLLEEPAWSDLAQRQLDWILGVNPFNASTVMGAGHNNPQHMFGLEYDPPTPYLPGAVMNGISGDEADEPQLRPGAWQETEYWTPMVAFTMWLMAELSAGSAAKR
jgi:hypothetical protein